MISPIKSNIFFDKPSHLLPERFAVNADRVANRQLVEDAVHQALASRPADDWIAYLQGRGISCSKINSVEEALNHAQTQADDMVIELDHPTAGKIRTLGIPYRFSATPAKAGQAPPELGADTDAILADIIGLDAAEIAALRDDGAI